MRDRSRFGMAMAAIIRMMATTISSSISEKPFCLRMFRKSPCNLGISIRPQLRAGLLDSKALPVHLVSACPGPFCDNLINLYIIKITSLFAIACIDQCRDFGQRLLFITLSSMTFFVNQRYQLTSPWKGKRDMALAMSPCGSYPPPGTLPNLQRWISLAD